MSRLPKSPAHLVLRGGIYYFRFTIPGHLRPIFQKSEIKRTLRTGHLVTARKRASFLGFCVSSFMDTIKKGFLPMLSESDRQSIRTAFEELVNMWIEGMEEELFRAVPVSDAKRERFSDVISECRPILMTDSTPGRLTPSPMNLTLLLTEQGVVLEKGVTRL